MLAETVAASEVQAAAFSRLSADVTFYTTLLGGRFYSDVPQGTAFPQAWLTFDNELQAPNGTFGRSGAIVRLMLHVYSTFEGDAEALAIMKRAVELFNTPLTVTGMTCPWVNRSRPPLWAVESFNEIALRHGQKPIDVYVQAS